MAIWDEVLTERDKEIFCDRDVGRKIEFGNKPALLIIDVTYNFVGDRPEPILKSMERFPFSCGEDGWKAVYQIASLLPLARQKRIPIIYSEPQRPKSLVPHWASKVPGFATMAESDIGFKIVKEIAPTDDDIIIPKTSSSIFFGTNIMSILVPLGIDTLLFCGGVTSGCIRASVDDAASYCFRVGVIAECTFDRVEVSHKISLFDMNLTRARVVSIAEARDYINKF